MHSDTMGATEYHPFLGWKCIGLEKAPLLCALSCRIFSLVPSSAEVERSFKVRIRVHNESGNRLSNDDAGRQSSLIYNTTKFKRIEEGVSTKRRGEGVEIMLLLGYTEYERRTSSGNILNRDTGCYHQVWAILKRKKKKFHQRRTSEMSGMRLFLKT